MPAGLPASEPSLAVSLERPTPTEDVSPVRAWIVERTRPARRRAGSSPSVAGACPGTGSHQAAGTVARSTNASSNATCSTVAPASASQASAATECCRYASKRVGRKTPSGQARRARSIGIAEAIPNLRAS